MHRILFLICLFEAAFFLTPLFAADETFLCPAIQKCLDITLPTCSKENLTPVKKIKYDSEYCAPFKEIYARGLDPKSKVGTELYGKLASEYRVIYEYKGSFPASESMLAFLFDHMPFTAKLVNAYQKQKYEIHYNSEDHRVFSGTNGRSLSGDFIWALQDSAGTKTLRRSVFLGYGRCHILKWDLTGTAVAFLDLDKNTKNEINYRLRAIVFPANPILNSIMQMDLFRKVVNSKINDIVKDVVAADKAYASGNIAPIEKSGLFVTEEDKMLLKEFEEVVNGKEWHLNDVFKGKGKGNGK